MTKWKPEIEGEKLVVFMVDECHLLWGDLLSYTLGRTDKRIEIPIKNDLERQTYYQKKMGLKPRLLRRNVFGAGHKSPLQKQLLTSDF